MTSTIDTFEKSSIDQFQMVDGTMTFTVDNGRGPITAIFKPNDRFNFCDGKWHEIHAVKVRILNSRGI